MSYEAPPPAYSPVNPSSFGSTSRVQRTQSTYTAPSGPPPSLNNRPQSMAAGYSGSAYHSPSSSYNAPSRVPAASLSHSASRVAQPGQPGQPVQRSNTRENQLAVLRRYETVLLVDDSASMVPLWGEATQAIMGIAEKAMQFDADGIDIHFLCSTYSQRNVRSVSQVQQIFNHVFPQGESTPTEIRIEELMGPYIDACEMAKAGRQPLPKPMNLLIITDGEADDPDTLAYTLEGFADRLHDIRAPLTQLGVQFVQIGNDPSATEALNRLDDDLKPSSGRDIVDSTPYQGSLTADFLLKALIGGVNRRMDSTG